jgi:aerobic carbon-monoxide dehydrogenase large subunit
MTAVGAARYAGSRVQRVEDARLLTGAGTFVDDITRPGMLHACFVRSPHPRARILSIGTAAALALPGVHAVFTADDLNGDVVEAWYTGTGNMVPDTPRPPLAHGEARFAGDIVALVVAGSRYLAEDAAELVDVDYEPLPAAADYACARATEALVHQGYPGNLAGELAGAPAETIADAYACAAHVVSETIREQAQGAVPMETRGLVAEWSRGSGELTVWAGTQAPHEVRMFAARLLGIPEHSVRVITRDVAGDFGQKVVPLREDTCVLLAARRLPAAVKWIEDRRENLQSAGTARARRGEARLRRGGDDPRRVARPRPGRWRVPDAVAGHDRRGDRDDLPWPVPGRQGNVQPRLGVLLHPRPDRLPGTVGVRDPGPRGHPRHRGPPDGHRPGGTAPQEPAAPR